MKKNKNSSFIMIFIGFVLTNALAGIFYRFNELFKTTSSLYLWLISFIGATVILLWGIKLHFSNYHTKVKKIAY